MASRGGTGGGVALLLILLAGLLLRLGIALPGLCGDPYTRFSRPDTKDYLILAEEFSGPKEAVSTRRAPGFPFLASVIFRCGGGAGSIAFVLALIGVSAGLLVYAAAREHGESGTMSAVAAGFYLFNLTGMANGPLLLSDTLFGWMAAFQLWCFLRGERTGHLTWAVLGMIVAAAGALIRPINSVWFLPGAVLILTQSGPKFSRRALAAVAGCCLFGLVLLPWMSRNAALGAGLTVDTNTGAMYHQNGAMLLAEVNNTDYESEKNRIVSEQELVFADVASYPDEKSREAYRKARMWELFCAHPFLMLKQHFNWHIFLPDLPTASEDLGFTRSDRGTMNVLRKDGIFAAVRHYFDGCWTPILLFAPFLCLAAVLYLAVLGRLGADCIRFGKRWRELLFFLAFAEYYLFLPGAIAAPRYQIPALPFLAVLAAAGIGALLGQGGTASVSAAGNGKKTTPKTAGKASGKSAKKSARRK